MYLDEGKPMRQALQALLTSDSGQHQQASSTTLPMSHSSWLASSRRNKGREQVPQVEPSSISAFTDTASIS